MESLELKLGCNFINVRRKYIFFKKRGENRPDKDLQTCRPDPIPDWRPVPCARLGAATWCDVARPHVSPAPTRARPRLTWSISRGPRIFTGSLHVRPPARPGSSDPRASGVFLGRFKPNCWVIGPVQSFLGRISAFFKGFYAGSSFSGVLTYFIHLSI